MQVKDIMSTDVEVVDRNDDLGKVADIMAAKRMRHVPVLEDGKVVAIVTQRDLFKATMSSAMGYGDKAQRAFLHSVRVKEIMTAPVITVTPETPVGEAAERMIRHGIGSLPVVDGSELIGMLTKTDLLRCLRTMNP